MTIAKHHQISKVISMNLSILLFWYVEDVEVVTKTKTTWSLLNLYSINWTQSVRRSSWLFLYQRSNKIILLSLSSSLQSTVQWYRSWIFSETREISVFQNDGEYFVVQLGVWERYRHLQLGWSQHQNRKSVNSPSAGSVHSSVFS